MESEFTLKPCIVGEDGVVDIPSITEFIHVGVDDRQFELPHVVVIVDTPIMEIGPDKLQAALDIAADFAEQYPPPSDLEAELPPPQPLFSKNLASIESAVALPIPLAFVQEVSAVVGQPEIITAIALFAARASAMLRGQCICPDCIARHVAENGVLSNQKGNA